MLTVVDLGFLEFETRYLRRRLAQYHQNGQPAPEGVWVLWASVLAVTNGLRFGRGR